MSIIVANDLISIDSQECLSSADMGHLYEKIIPTARFFGFLKLPRDLKVHLKICNKEEFEKEKQITDFKDICDIVAFTYNINHVCVLRRDCLKDRVSDDFYDAVIVHECTHIFQLYNSRLPQNKYVWLYETVACYLAGQKKTYTGMASVTWKNFVDDFYNVSDCYGLAYVFGEKLFLACSEDVLKIIKTPDKYEILLKNLFYSI